MKSTVRFMLFALCLSLVTITGSGCGVVRNIIGAPKDVLVVYENVEAHKILWHKVNGDVFEMYPGDLLDEYVPVSEKATVRWTYPDLSGGKTISFRPDAQLADATGPNGLKADTWITSSGRVQNAIALPKDYQQRLVRTKAIILN